MRSEFEFINHIKEKHGLGRVGDDCAVLPKDARTDLVVTSDLLIEDVDFRQEWTNPRFLGHKALAVSLSDVAAMGARPVWALISIGVPEKLWTAGFAEEFYEGYAAMAERFKIEIAGGDVSRSPDKLVIDSIAAGETEKGRAVLRSGAKPGDKIYVTGPVGGAAGGLELLEKGLDLGSCKKVPQRKLLHRQMTPWPKVEDGLLLARLGVTSMIDISDGISSDLAHICNASGVGARIWADRIPFDRKLGRIGASRQKQLKLALEGGEDYELLFTADLPAPELAGYECIGEITPNTGDLELVEDGETVILKPGGFQHFSS